MAIDPTNYKIAISLDEAAVAQAQATAKNAARETVRWRELTRLAVTKEEGQTRQAWTSLCSIPTILIFLDPLCHD
jgi:multidrug resistance efflux pump